MSRIKRAMPTEKFNRIVMDSLLSMMLFPLATILALIFFRVIGGISGNIFIIGAGIFQISLLAATFQAMYFMFFLTYIRRLATTNVEVAIYITTFISLVSNIVVFFIITSGLQVSLSSSFILLIISSPILLTLIAPFVLAYYAMRILSDDQTVEIQRAQQQRKPELEFTAGVYGGKEGVKLKKSKRKEKPKNDDGYNHYLIDEESQSMHNQK